MNDEIEDSGDWQEARTIPARNEVSNRRNEWNRRKIINWRAIREAVVAGMPRKEAAALYGSTPGSITVKATREQWPTPERVKAEAERTIREATERLERARWLRATGGRQAGPSDTEDGEDGDTEGGDTEGGVGGTEDGETEWEEGGRGTGVGGSLAPSSPVSRPPNIAARLGESLATMAESGSLSAARRALSSIKRAPRSLPIRSASDLATLAKLLRSMAGLDQPQVAVSLGLFSPQPPDSSTLGMVIDCDAEAGEDEQP